MSESSVPEELKNVGKWVSVARAQEGWTQQQLADRAGLSQPRVSYIENGEVLPTLPQLLSLAHALMRPLQWFLSGRSRPGLELPDLAFQLHYLGIVDLLVPNAVVPGAYRPTETVLAILVREKNPNPRILEALPAVLAWKRWSFSRLHECCRPRNSRATIRLAWLADVALTIHRTTGFPGGCPQREQLEKYLEPLKKAKLSLKEDGLGRPGDADSLPPVSKRWRITYDAPLSAFVDRAKHLNQLLEQSPRFRDESSEGNDE